MNIFEYEDHKPPWKAVQINGIWDVTSDRKNPNDEYSITEVSDDEKLCKLWAAAPDLLRLLKFFCSPIIDSDESVGKYFGNFPENFKEARELIRKIEE